MMKSLSYFIVLVTLFSFDVTAQSLINYEWSNQDAFEVGSYDNYYIEPTQDSSNNLYTSYSVGSSNYSTLSKYSSAGALLSSYSLDGNKIYVSSMKISSDGYLYLTGYCHNSNDFDLSSGVYTIDEGIFVAKYDLSFNLQWAISNQGDEPGKLDFDSNGNLIITGTYVSNGNVDICFGSGTDYHSSAYGTSTTYHNWNIFFCKIDKNGNYLWGKDIDAEYDEIAFDLCIDKNDNIIIAGTYMSKLNDFSYGSSTYSLPFSGAGGAVFIAKYNTNGYIITAASYMQSYPTSSTGDGYTMISIDCDDNNNIFIAGDYTNSIDIDLSSSGTTILTTYDITFNSDNTKTDFFIAKYDENLIYKWSHSIGLAGDEHVCDLTIDQNDQFYIVGNTTKNVDFDLNSSGGIGWTAGPYMAKYDNDGNFIWLYTFDDVSNINAEGSELNTIHITRDNSIIVGGGIKNSSSNTAYFDVDLDGGTDNLSLPPNTQTAFISVYSQCIYPTSAIINVTNNVISKGSSTTLSIGSGNLYSATNWYWYSDSCSGNLVGTGNSILVSPMDTTIYFVRAEGGCIAPSGCQSISIFVTEPNVIITGGIYAENGDTIRNIDVSLSGDTNQYYLSENGNYQFSIPTSLSISVSPSKNNDSLVSNGISTLDILYIQKHILNIDTLSSPYKIIAADVNSSSSISTLDILYLQSLILGNMNSFPGNKLWTFIPSDFIFFNQTSPFPYDTSRIYNSISLDKINQDFIGIKLGDVNDSWNNTISKTSITNKLSFIMENQTVQSGDTIIVPLRVTNFVDITGFQFTIRWNNSLLQLVSTNKEVISPQFGSIDNVTGNLNVLWFDSKTIGKSFADSTTLFYLVFVVTGSNGSSAELSINSNVITAEAYDKDLNVLSIDKATASIDIVLGTVTNVEENVNPISNFYCYPNPAGSIIHIEFPSDSKNKPCVFKLFDVVGKLVYQDIVHENKAQISVSNLQEGTYFVQVENENWKEVKKISIKK